MMRYFLARCFSAFVIEVKDAIIIAHYLKTAPRLSSQGKSFKHPFAVVSVSIRYLF